MKNSLWIYLGKILKKNLKKLNITHHRINI